MNKFSFILTVFGLLLINNFLYSASVGDYRTAQSSVTWTNASHWQVWDGSSWSTAATAPSSSNDVYIQSGHTATLSSNVSCNSIFLSTGETSPTAGSNALIELQSYTLSVNGKLCCYYGTVNTTNGSTSLLTVTISTVVPSLGISKSSGGVLKIVGNSRILTNIGEWGAGTGSTDLFDIEIALNTGETIEIKTTIKSCNWTITSGTVNIGSSTISADNGTLGQGDVTINEGAVLISSGTGTSNSIIQRTGTDACGTLTLNGTIKTSGYSPYIQSATINIGNNGTIEYSASGPQSFINSSFTGASELLNYKNIIISGSGSKTTLASKTTSVLSDGSLTIKGGTLLIGSGGNLNVSTTNTTLIYSGTTSQSITSTVWNSDFQNLKIDNSAGVSMSGFSRTLSGNLYLISGTFSNGSNLTLGNSSEIIIANGSINSAPNFGTSVKVTYNQSTSPITSGNEIPTSSSVLNNLTINNTNGLTLNSTTTVNGVLTLTSGKITSSNSNLLVLKSGATISGGSVNSFVSGPLRKEGSADFTFAIGKSNNYSPITLSSNSGGSSDYFTAEYFNSAPSNRSNLGSSLTGGLVSSVEYWDINPNNSQSAKVTLYWNSTNSGITNLAASHLVVAHYDGSNWESDDNTASSGTSSAGYVTSATISGWGNFTFASPNNQNPLPVKFLNFTVNNTDKFSRTLIWTTATEINNVGFELQKSVDSFNFTKIAFVNSKSKNGNSFQNLNYKFSYFENNLNYKFYRIKQIDYDGKNSFSSIKKLYESDSFNSNYFIYENKLYINTNLTKNFISITDFTGKIIFHSNFFNHYVINLADFKNGLYIIYVNNVKPTKIFIDTN
ncbi:MAG: hypothetical protein IT243_09820 [Bacteroidia bacterium]|nr:hypothetical protein [Bacteroidia bacterium]